MNEVLEDEIVSINAIYTESTLSRLSDGPTVCSLAIPGEHHIALRLEFPIDYPDAPPSILGTQSVGDTLPKGFGTDAVDLARDILGQVYTVGSPCIFDLVEELQSQIQSVLPPKSGEEQIGESHGQATDLAQNDLSDQTQSVNLPDIEPPWIVSDTVTEKKSVFLARAAAVASREEAESYVAHLLATNKAASQATHNITAWRISGEGNTSIQDCDDDGESAAGGRLLHLLQLMDVWNVMVVVSRWYGGVHLGPARFRLINTVARDAVVRGKFAEHGHKRGEGKSEKKGAKK